VTPPRSEFELGMATGRLYAPSPWWALGWWWGTWLGTWDRALRELAR